MGTDQESYTDVDLCEASTYSYRVRAKRESGQIWTSPWSVVDLETTPAMIAPSNISASVDTDISAQLIWDDNSPDETGFKFDRCMGQGCSDFAEIPVSVGSDIESYVDDYQLLPATWYTYRVKAFKTATCSWEITDPGTSSAYTSSAAPGILVATAVNSQVIDLDWTDVSWDEDGFELEKQIWNGTFVQIATFGPGETHYTDTRGIEPDKWFTYRVRSFRGPDPSSYTVDSVLTPAWSSAHHTCY